MRDNRGTMVVDKADEDFKNVSTPLGTLDKLQAQSQEQMASIAGIPIVLLLMITPHRPQRELGGRDPGLLRLGAGGGRSSSCGLHLTTVINMIQVSLFGEVDPDITYTFAPLWGLNELEEAQRDLAVAQTDAAYTGAGILNAEEVRERPVGRRLEPLPRHRRQRRAGAPGPRGRPVRRGGRGQGEASGGRRLRELPCPPRWP